MFPRPQGSTQGSNNVPSPGHENWDLVPLAVFVSERDKKEGIIA
jgi:hypothetical protein